MAPVLIVEKDALIIEPEQGGPFSADIFPDRHFA